jgi:hypothetical protein
MEIFFRVWGRNRTYMYGIKAEVNIEFFYLGKVNIKTIFTILGLTNIQI